MKPIKVLAIAATACLLAGIVFIYSGVMPPGADQPHSSLVYQLLETTRERGIAVRASKISVPPLDDPALIRSGAGNYNAMCSGCHLMPGVNQSELSKGLYPAPPPLAEVEDLDPAEAFWVIKHGIKASGMPAWGKSMDDRFIWGMVAFLKRLPTLSEEQYKTEVACSGGHSHGGSVTVEHGHEQAAVDCGPGGGTGAGDDHTQHDVDAAAADHDGGHEHEHEATSMPRAGGDDDEHGHAPGAEHEHAGPGAATAKHEHAAADAAPVEHDHAAADAAPAEHEHAAANAGAGGHAHAGSKTVGTEHSGMPGMDHSDMPAMDHSSMGHGTGIAAKPLPIRNAAEAAVQAFQDALQVGNRKLVLQWLDPAVRIEEGGHTETSRSEYASGHLQSDIDFLKSARVYPQSRNSRVTGDSATVNTQTRIVAQADGKPVDVLSHEVATLRKTAEGWRIVRVQWSSTPGDRAAPAPTDTKPADDGHDHQH